MPAVLLALFFLSGGTGLLFEVVWTRQLSHIFGSDTLAISTVLATFMGGLALGSWLGGRIADSRYARTAVDPRARARYLRRDPLLAYAACEAGIALLALAIPRIIDALPPANAWLWQRLWDTPALLALARFGLCALLLVPPTTLMGATLPLLARRVVRSETEMSSLGVRIGALYAANTAGAVAGVAGAGFWLIPTIGVSSTNRVAITIDLVIALTAVALARLSRTRAVVVPEPEPEPEPPPAPLHRRIALVAFSISGFVAMTLEVLWSRALSLVIGSSIYSFTLVLVVFLLGLSTGAAWIGRPAARSRDPLGVLAVVFVLAGASVVLTHAVADDLPRLFLWLLEGSTASIGTILFYQALLAGTALLPTAVCLGAIMPLCVRAYVGSADAVGRDVGRAYAANTVGAILGSFAGGFVVLPLVGLERGVKACAIADLALAAALGALAPRRRVRRVTVAAAPALAAIALLLPSWNRAELTAGVFRMTLARRYVTAGAFHVPEMIYYRDGVVTTVTVERHGDAIAMKNNGKVEASSRGDMPTQILVGLLPVLLHGQRGGTSRVAVVGYGSGVTVGAIAESPQVERVDVVELEPAVYDAADRFFGPYNHQPERNPKVRRFVGDGRNFLTAHPETYDVIVSEPSNPWIAGVASLFTREFYAFAKRHLAPGGVFCQWAQLYELGPRNVKMIYRTFHEAFPYVYAFSAGDLSADTILVGSERPLRLQLDVLRERVRDPAVKAELARGGVESAEELLALVLLTPGEAPAFAAGGDINTDDNATLEFTAPRDLLAAIRGTRFADSIYHDGWPYGRLEPVLDFHDAGPGLGRDHAELAAALASHGRRTQARFWLDRLGGPSASGDPVAVEVERLLRLARVRDVLDPELPLDAGGPPLSAPSAAWFRRDVPEAERRAAVEPLRRALAFLGERRWEDARAELAKVPAPAESDEGRDLQLVSSFVLYKTLSFEQAEEILADLADDAAYAARRPAVVYYLGRVRYGQGKFEKGAESLRRFASAHPSLAETL